MFRIPSLTLPSLALLCAAPAAAAPVPDLDCLASAEESLLDEEKSEWLCMGARGPTPHRCYERAREATVLGVDEAIELCRCAVQPAAPVACFESQDDSTTLNRDRIVAGCRPVTQRRLVEGTCLPLTERRETSLDPYALPRDD